MTAETNAAALAEFPPRILELIRMVADRRPGNGRGPYEDAQGEPMQDDADTALAWIKSAALLRAGAAKVPQFAPQAVEDALAIADAIEEKTLLHSDIRNMAARTIRRLAATPPDPDAGVVEPAK